MSPSIWQTIHVLGRRPRLLKEHLREMSRHCLGLYRVDFTPDLQAVEQAIVELLNRERYPQDRSVGVTLWAEPSGAWRVEALGEALYRGYVLRALRPEAQMLAFDLPFGGAPTAAARLTWQTARTIVAERKANAVVRLDAEGRLCEADGAPLYVAVGRTIYTSHEGSEVEAGLAAEAIRRAGYTLCVEPLPRTWLPKMEELFYVDYRGVTSLQSCDRKLLMSVMATRVAEAMESIFSKK